MSAPGTVDLMLIRAAANGEITWDADARNHYRWNGTEVDYDCYGKLYYLAKDGYLSFDEDADQSPVLVTAEGLAEIR
jgi:hypothetical protein